LVAQAANAMSKTGANTTMIGAAVYCVAPWFPGQGRGRARGLYAGGLAGVDAGAGAVAPVGQDSGAVGRPRSLHRHLSPWNPR